MKHYVHLDNPSQPQLERLLAEGWEFYSEQTTYVTKEHWPYWPTIGTIRGDDIVESHWAVTLIKVDQG